MVRRRVRASVAGASQIELTAFDDRESACDAGGFAIQEEVDGDGHIARVEAATRRQRGRLSS